MYSVDSHAARQFALEVVKKLRAAGFEALWAGGCVRDELLGRTPKDYDVATSAEPQQIRAVFGHRRTIPMGAAFGVITVLGPKPAGQVEVATFRRDSQYSDGRHPDQVTFSNAREDARRRDFTINGLFLDPLDGKLVDYVGGEADLQQRLIRAIGDPHERLEEDKLRMLRAVRFAATFEFEIEKDTRNAIREHAQEIVVVSAERIGEELRRMLVHPQRRRAVELLSDTLLLQHILPEIRSPSFSTQCWTRTLEILERLVQPTVSVALAALLREIVQGPRAESAAESICRRWKLSNHEMHGVLLCLGYEGLLRAARQVPWPTLQRVLILERIGELLDYSAAVASVLDGSTAEIDYCRAKLELPPEQLNPAPLLTGNDLREMGIPRGPIYKQLLEQTRDAQLEGIITSKEEAREFACRRYSETLQSSPDE